MTGNTLFCLFIFVLLVFGTFFAGCSDEPPPAVAVSPVTTGSGPKFEEGDIIATASSSASSTLYYILEYDAKTDEYTRALIEKNADGSWGHRTSDRTEQSPRAVVERVYTVRVGHVDVSSVPVVTPTFLPQPAQTISGYAPVISNISPGSAFGDAAVSVTITGTNFQEGATVKLVKPGSAPVTATGVSLSGGIITCILDLNGRSEGSYNLIVINPDGQSDSKQNIFSIGEAPPMITGMNPVTAELGGRVPLSIYGQNFRNNIKVSFTKDTVELVCTNPLTMGSSRISCDLNLHSTLGASAGDWTVTVLNIDNQKKGTWTKKFVVTDSGTGND